MSLEYNHSLVRRYFEQAPHNVQVFDEILSNEFCVHSIQHITINPEGDERGPQAFKNAATWLNSVWTDPRMVVDELIAEGDRVWARWTFQGRHTGELFGIPPTGKQVSYSGINIFRVADGKLAECWDIFDRLWLWQQLGVLADTGEFLAQARKNSQEK